jgi:hypothetical protein
MNRVLPVMLILLAIWLMALPHQVAAHSTAGRIKVDLTEKMPGMDDFAYFMESYVHRELYRNRFEQWEKRFYVKEFLRVDRSDNRAVVHFLTLDHKENKDFADRMTFHRGEDGRWWFQSDNGERVVVYTYIPKSRYIYEKYLLPAASIGLSFAMVLLFGLVWRRRRLGKCPDSAEGVAT